MLTFLVVLAVFSILIIVHELGHMFMAKGMGIKVEIFSLGLGKKLFGIRKGDTEYVISLIPFGGYVKFAGDSPSEHKGRPEEFLSKSPLKRFMVIIGGSASNYIFAFLLFTSVLMVGEMVQTTQVRDILPNYPAATSGLEIGDRIIEIDNEKVEEWNELVEIVQKKTSNAPSRFKIEREGKIITLKIIPKVVKGKDRSGKEFLIGQIGIRPQTKIIPRKYTFFEAISLGGKNLIITTGLLYKGLWQIITGRIPVKQALGGPLEIAFIIGDALSLGFMYLVGFMAFINVALAVFNLLPIPILDGGHILFLVIEKLRKRPLSQRTQETVAQIALYVLIAFVIFVFWNDLSRRWDDIIGKLPFIKK